MKRVVHLLIFVFLLTGFALINSCKKDPVIPTLTTNEVTDITVSTATSGGVITKDGGAAVTARGVCWGSSALPTISGSHTSDSTGAGSFESKLADLTSNTTYHVRAYATNSAGTAYGNEVTFTSTPIVVPTLTTAAISSIAITTAVSGGNITADGNGEVTARGVCWSTTTGPTTTNSKTSDATGTGSFTSNLTALVAGTTYYVRAYATNSAGTAYGNEITFITNTVVGSPTNVAATAGNAQATVTFTAPVSNGGSAITGYTVTSIPGGLTKTGTSSPLTVTGLTNGTAYTFTVIATNANGNSAPSTASNSVTPATVPGTPTIGTATAGNTQASVAFTAPASNGGSAITGYTVTSSPGGFTGTGTTSPIAVTGLTNGTAYTFTVFATNAKGNSTASSASNSVIPASVPGAPTIGTATKGNAQSTVTFTAPSNNGGSAITGYTVTSTPGSITATGTASPITVTGLTNGTAYTFTVTAANATGSGTPSAALNSVTPSTVPGAPTIGTATKGNAQAIVAFTAPASNGGSAITGYTVTSSPGGIVKTGTASPLTVTGLTNGTAYTFTVVATNANGNSVASSASNSVIPSTVPGAPTIGIATKGNAQATITFTPPVSNGGSAITGYTVTSSPSGLTGTGSSSPIIVTGLTNGITYTFTVFATNASGNSIASSASNAVVPSTVPGAPTIGTVTEGNAQASVPFTAPVNDGGSAIDNYTVTSTPGGFIGTGLTSPIIVTGLTNGTAYTFRVTANNINGDGLPSSVSNAVRPHTATTVYDVEGTLYNLVTIGGQIWMKENLKTATYNNGVAIPTTATVDLRVEATPKYQWVYNNDNANLNPYGRLYTYYAVVDPAGVCPSGMHVPSDAEWITFHAYLKANFAYTPGFELVGKALATTSGWTTDGTAGNVGNNQPTNNATAFSAVPAGYRKANGDPTIWNDLGGNSTFFRSSSVGDLAATSWYYSLEYNQGILYRGQYGAFNGYSVRCVK
jgi:uncharacterized protein (TIGR02145 family)